MFERFTEGARTVVSDAVEQACALGHDPVGTQHLLLGLLNPCSGARSQVLRAAGPHAGAPMAWWQLGGLRPGGCGRVGGGRWAGGQSSRLAVGVSCVRARGEWTSG